MTEGARVRYRSGVYDSNRCDAMRERADEIVPDSTLGIVANNRAFFHKGVTGQWQELLDDAGRRRYAERVEQIAPPDLIVLAHREPIGNLSTG